MEKIKLNMSGSLVGIILPSTQTFQEIKISLKEIMIKNYRLLKIVKFYRIESKVLNETELLELGKVVEKLVNLKSVESRKETSIEKKKVKYRLHYGNLRSGEKINSETNLVILGNLNPGSYIKSKKNIFVYGKAMGTIEIESKNFIYLEEADQVKIKISDKHLMYDSEDQSKKLLFSKKAGEIRVRKIEKKEIDNLLKKIGFDLI